jgi:hypothetical protein
MPPQTQNSSKQHLCRTSLVQWDAFLSRIITVMKPEFRPTTHWQKDNQWNGIISCHHGQKKFKVQTSAGKVMASVFWDSEGILLVEFLERGATINSQRYVQTLKKLKHSIRRVQPNRMMNHDSTPVCSQGRQH